MTTDRDTEDRDLWTDAEWRRYQPGALSGVVECSHCLRQFLRSEEEEGR